MIEKIFEPPDASAAYITRVVFVAAWLTFIAIFFLMMLSWTALVCIVFPSRSLSDVGIRPDFLLLTSKNKRHAWAPVDVY